MNQKSVTETEDQHDLPMHMFMPDRVEKYKAERLEKGGVTGLAFKGVGWYVHRWGSVLVTDDSPGRYNIYFYHGRFPIDLFQQVASAPVCHDDRDR